MLQANLSQIQQCLSGVHYPADKSTLLKSAKNQGADESVCASLEQLPDMFYATSEDVSQEIGKLSGIEVMSLKEFLLQAIQDSMVEIELCQMALQKSNSEDVKAFSQKMIDNHSMMQNEMQKLAFDSRILPPGGPGPDDRSHLEKLSQLSGKEFDIAFLNYNIEEHEKDIKVFSHYAEQGGDARIKKMAGNMVGMLNQHLQMCRDIAGKLQS